MAGTPKTFSTGEDMVEVKVRELLLHCWCESVTTPGVVGMSKNRGGGFVPAKKGLLT